MKTPDAMAIDHTSPTASQKPSANHPWGARRPVVLVACAASKLDHPTPARDLYISTLFRASRAYAEAISKPNGAWFILSAKHGLLEPETVLAPYNQTLRDMSRSERERWGVGVAAALQARTDPTRDALVFLAGMMYRDQVATTLARAGYQIVTPLQGLRIGEQVHWLQQAYQAMR